MKIKRVEAFQIYDSRGKPTVECTVTTEDGVVRSGLVPSGASTGRTEALELRDRDPLRFRGEAVFSAVRNIEDEIAPLVEGMDVFDQEAVDETMCDLDGTVNKSRLGGNAILAVSMAVANAAAAVNRVPLFDYLGNGRGYLMPMPQIQLFGGGAHSAWRTDIQDFLVVPVGAEDFPRSLEITHNIYHAAGDWMREQNKFYGVADEGGFWPEFDSHTQVLDAVVKCIELAGYSPGKDVAIALDVAASELYDGALYRFSLEDRALHRDQLLGLFMEWCANYPIVSLEDPFSDQDPDGWSSIRAELGDRVQLIGDDLFTTNIHLIEKGVEGNLANAVLIKPNQIGTLTETLAAIRLTQASNWRPIVSARSGETEDALISHLAVATNAGQIKVGSFARSERMAKWNELLRIGRCLSDNKAVFAGRTILEPR